MSEPEGQNGDQPPPEPYSPQELMDMAAILRIREEETGEGLCLYDCKRLMATALAACRAAGDAQLKGQHMVHVLKWATLAFGRGGRLAVPGALLRKVNPKWRFDFRLNTDTGDVLMVVTGQPGIVLAHNLPQSPFRG